MAAHEAGGFVHDDDGNLVRARPRAAEGSIVYPDQTPRGADGFFEAAESLLGSRCLFTDWGEAEGVRVIVLDLTDSDTAALEAMAEEVGMAGRAQIEGASSAQVALWGRLRDDLESLRQRRPPALRMPSRGAPFLSAPVEIHLTEASMAVAAELERVYGDYVDLRVGALRFKHGTLHRDPALRPRDVGDRQVVDPETLSVRLDGPLVVAAGGYAIHRVLLTNHTAAPVTIMTGPQIAAHIINADDEIVAGYAGPMQAVAVQHVAPPGETTSVEVLVSTTSFDPGLGPSAPPGQWRITIPLNVHRGQTIEALTSPPLDVTIIGRGDAPR